MCGIALAVHQEIDGQEDGVFDALVGESGRRGPGSQGAWSDRVTSKGGIQLRVKIHASVLNLREEIQAQPVVGTRGVLAWNGQIFEGLQIPAGGSDTQGLANALESGADAPAVLAAVEGPYAFVYYEFATRTLYFGRDPFGRRSLLFTRTSSPFYLSSVRPPGLAVAMVDVSCASLWKLCLGEVGMRDGQLDFSAALSSISRAKLALPSSPKHYSEIPRVNRAVPSSDALSRGIPEQAVLDFTAALRASVRLRLESIPEPAPGSARVAILFSGGIDCSLLAYLAHAFIPAHEPIDLINVGFENPRSLAGQFAQARQPKRFAGPPVAPAEARAPIDPYAVPDRLTGREAVAELRVVCPERAWRFVEVDVPYAEAQAERARVRGLMYPNDTEMDLSLALPLYFAARGAGTVNAEGGSRAPYRSAAKAFISGLGADELLAGYSRHRRAFDTGSWTGAIEELQMDLDRLPTRNLGRDDRIISSHGRETRFPYLGLSFVAHAAALPVSHKIGRAPPHGELADKLVLRAACRLAGLVGAAARKKRAMQFGTRSARMEAELGGSRTSRGMGARRLVEEE